ncbi:MAG: V-type ATP synthase subunit C [Tissierellaceae bacterium]|nr:V-type ATP synthase subunit C [Tissierellaceae bacterium]
MDRMQFIQGVTRTRVFETRLLSRPKIDRMIDADDIDEVIKLLNETEYSKSLIGISRTNDYEKILSNELRRVYDLMREVSVEQVVVDLLALKYDYHNLKVLIKEQEFDKDLSDLYLSIGTIDPKKFKQAYKDGDFSEISKKFKNAIEATITDLEENKDPQRIDIVLDRYYFEHLYEMAKDTKIDLFTEYVKDMIDFINVRSSIRMKKQGKEFKFFEDVILENGNIEKEIILSTYGDSIETMIQKYKNSKISSALVKGLNSYIETDRLSEFEKYMDDYLMDINKKSKYINFGPEPIFSYIIAKEAEIKNLRIIMISKINNLSPDVIRGRVSDLYV